MHTTSIIIFVAILAQPLLLMALFWADHTMSSSE